MFATIKSLFASTANVAQIIEQGTEQGLDEVKALRAQRQLANASELAALQAEFTKAGLGTIDQSTGNK